MRRFTALVNTGAPFYCDGGRRIIDMAGLTTVALPFPLLMRHDFSLVIGHVDKVDISKTDVRAEGVVSGVSPVALEALALAESGFRWRVSGGWHCEKLEEVTWPFAGVNGRTVHDVVIARKTVLYEISLVPCGADPDTIFQLIDP